MPEVNIDCQPLPDQTGQTLLVRLLERLRIRFLEYRIVHKRLEPHYEGARDRAATRFSRNCEELISAASFGLDFVQPTFAGRSHWSG